MSADIHSMVTQVIAERDASFAEAAELRERVRVLEGALRPFAALAEDSIGLQNFNADDSWGSNWEALSSSISVGDMRTASSVMGEK